jgi:PAS domain-containing protein
VSTSDKTFWEPLWDDDPNGLLALDQEMCVRVVNPAFCRMFRVNAAESEGRPAAGNLVEEILRADSIDVVVGQKINESYQNPLLPKIISIRRSLFEEPGQLIRGLNKEVVIVYC